MLDIEATKREMGEMLKTFQHAIIDLAAKTKAAQAANSLGDVDSVNYVVGMVTVNSANLERLIKEDESFFVGRELMIGSFLSDARQFARKLRDEGVGLAPESLPA